MWFDSHSANLTVEDFFGPGAQLGPIVYWDKWKLQKVKLSYVAY